MTTAYDYSSGPIDPAALKAAGATTVMRYVSTPGNSKNITAAEYKALTDAGITVGLVYETTAGWMLGGYSAGLAAARSARSQATAIGYEPSKRIWYADDFADTAAQIPIVLDALHGCSDGDGSKLLVALYADYDAIEASVVAGYAAPWQTDAWSSGRRSPHAVLYQTGQQTTCGGVQVDVNDLTGELFTQAVTPQTPTVQEDDDMTITSTNGRAGLAWSSGAKHVVEAQYGNANMVDLVLDVELKGKGGSVYPGTFTVPHAAGSATYRIPAQYVPTCTGVILTVKSGPASVVYDVYAA